MSYREFGQEAEQLRRAFASLQMGSSFTSKQLGEYTFGDDFRKNKKRVWKFVNTRLKNNEIIKTDVHKGRGVLYVKKRELPLYEIKVLRLVPPEHKSFMYHWNTSINKHRWYTCESFRGVLRSKKSSHADSEAVPDFLWNLKEMGIANAKRNPDHRGNYLYSYKRRIKESHLPTFVKRTSEKVGVLTITKKVNLNPKQEKVTMPKNPEAKKKVVNSNQMTFLEIGQAIYEHMNHLGLQSASAKQALKESTDRNNNLREKVTALTTKIEEYRICIAEMKKEIKTLNTSHQQQLDIVSEQARGSEERAKQLEIALLKQEKLVEDKDVTIHKLQQELLEPKPQTFNIADILKGTGKTVMT